MLSCRLHCGEDGEDGKRDAGWGGDSEDGVCLGSTELRPGASTPYSGVPSPSYPLGDVGEADFNTFYVWPAKAMLSAPGWLAVLARLPDCLLPGRVCSVRSGCCSVWRPHTFSSVIWRVLPPPRAAAVPGLWEWHPVGSGELVTDLPVLGWSHLLLPDPVTSGVRVRPSASLTLSPASGGRTSPPCGHRTLLLLSRPRCTRPRPPSSLLLFLHQHVSPQQGSPFSQWHRNCCHFWLPGGTVSYFLLLRGLIFVANLLLLFQVSCFLCLRLPLTPDIFQQTLASVMSPRPPPRRPHHGLQPGLASPPLLTSGTSRPFCLGCSRSALWAPFIRDSVLPSGTELSARPAWCPAVGPGACRSAPPCHPQGPPDQPRHTQRPAPLSSVCLRAPRSFGALFGTFGGSSIPGHRRHPDWETRREEAGHSRLEGRGACGHVGQEGFPPASAGIFHSGRALQAAAVLLGRQSRPHLRVGPGRGDPRFQPDPEGQAGSSRRGAARWGAGAAVFLSSCC